MDLIETNKQIRYLSNVIDYQVTSRGLVESQLFPVTAYICVSFYNSYQILYDILKKVTERITPEEMGSQSRKILSELHTLSLFYIPLYYLSGRMGTIVMNGGDSHSEPKEKREETAFIVDFWKRMALSYFDNGKKTVYEANFQNQILNQTDIDWVQEKLYDVSSEEASTIKKTFANLEVVSFLDECEARAKLCDHGPYRINNDEVMVLREIVHLYDGKKPHFPWSKTEAKAPYENIAVAIRLKGVETKFDDFATLSTEPEDFANKITGATLLTRRGNSINEIPFDKLHDFDLYADDATSELFLRFSEWDKRERLLAGAYAYCYGYARYTNFVGITNQVNFDMTEYTMKELVPYFMENEFDPGIPRYFREDREKETDPTLFLIPTE